MGLKIGKVILRDHILSTNAWSSIELPSIQISLRICSRIYIHPVKFDYGKMIRKESAVEGRGLDIREKIRKIYITGGL